MQEHKAESDSVEDADIHICIFPHLDEFMVLDVRDPQRPPRVAFRYLGENPNGTTDMIAGVVSDDGNVIGLMPHPEHAVDARLGSGSADGVRVLDAFLGACLAGGA